MSSIGGSGINRTLAQMQVSGGGAVESLQAQIQNASSQLIGLAGDLQALVGELQALTQQYQDAANGKPVRGKHEKKGDFDRRMATWQAEMSGLGEKLRGLQERIAGKQGEIERKQQEVSMLQGRMPTAQADDRRKIEQAMDAARRDAEQAREAGKRQDGAESVDRAKLKKADQLLKPGAPRGGGIPMDPA